MPDLAERLRRGATVTPGMGPAVELLINDGWLDNDAFVEECVTEVDDEIALVDWLEVDQYVSDRIGVQSLLRAQRIARTARAGHEPVI